MGAAVLVAQRPPTLVESRLTLAGTGTSSDWAVQLRARNSARRFSAPPLSTPMAMATRRSCCSIAPPSHSCSSVSRMGCTGPAAACWSARSTSPACVTSPTWTATAAIETFGDRWHRSLWSAPDRTERTAAQNHRHVRIEAATAGQDSATSPRGGRRQRRRLPGCRPSPTWRNNLSKSPPTPATPSSLPPSRSKFLRRKTFRNVADAVEPGATWPLATWTATAELISCSSSTTASSSCARTPGSPALNPARPVSRRRPRLVPHRDSALTRKSEMACDDLVPRSAWEHRSSTRCVSAVSPQLRDAERQSGRSHAGAWEREPRPSDDVALAFSAQV